MKPQSHPVEVLIDECWLDLAELGRRAGVSEAWLHARVTQGLLVARDEGRFGLAELHRVRRMAGLERDFDAVPELAALVADLEAELAALRRRLQRLGG